MSAEASDFVELGEVIGGYRLERLLGAVSTSQVFLGKHVVLGRRAAIKVLVDKLIGNEEVINRLLTEAKVVNDIRHPNIIDISDFINTGVPRRVALVMEYIEGPSLTICREHPLTFEQAIGTMLQLIAAVRAAHAAGIIHRDIKPDNLLLTTDPRQNMKEVPTLKVVDFGIAKMAHSNLAQTAVGTMLGTPAYMAPEQIAGRPRPSAATDVFAIGEVLYEVLSSKRAYPAGTISETVRAKLRGELPELELPPMPGDEALLEIIRRCLSHRPEDRPGLQEIQNVLEAVRPNRQRIDTFEELEDVDASESDTRMVESKPVPPGATTELSPFPTGAHDGTPSTRVERRLISVEELGPTVAVPLPSRPRRIAIDITSPTNRVLPALTEIEPYSDRYRGQEIPNAPTMPGTLNHQELDAQLASGTNLIRDEQSLAIGELRIGNADARASDDESSVQLSELQMSRLQGTGPISFDDDDPLRIVPPPLRSDVALEPLAESEEGLPALGLSQPAGMGSYEPETDLDALDGRDLEEEEEPLKHDLDGAATMPPTVPAPSPFRPDSFPEVPDTRITMRPSAPERGSNRFFYIVVALLIAGAAIFFFATRRIDPAPVRTAAPISPQPVQREEEPAPGRFRIESIPAGADVLHISEDPDSEPLPLGKTPLELELAGSTWPQRLRIVHSEYVTLEVEATPSRKLIKVTLERK